MDYISSTRWPALLRSSYTNRLNPENKRDVRNVPLSRRAAPRPLWRRRHAPHWWRFNRQPEEPRRAAHTDCFSAACRPARFLISSPSCDDIVSPVDCLHAIWCEDILLANNLYEIESILAHADDAAEPTLAPVVWVAAISGPSRIEPVLR